METLFVFLNVQLLIFLLMANLQMLLEIGLLKRKKNKKTKTKTKTNRNKSKKKKNQNCIKSGLSQFLFLQQKM